MSSSPHSVLVVGSVALDTVTTPAGTVDDGLGGSASFFGLAAVKYAPVRMVAVAGTDFPEEHLSLFRRHGLDVGGLQLVEGRTFRWAGVYSQDMNERETLRTELNVFEGFHPELPNGYAQSGCLFLANIDPTLQLEVLESMQAPQIVALDTMNYWISSKRDELLKVLERVDLFLINDSEARLLTGQENVLRAAEGIRMMGPSTVVVKRGEYGALARTENGWFSLPAYPVEGLKDPTGAGDSFAGGLLGYLAHTGGRLDEANLRLGLAHGAAVASFVVEEFSVGGLLDLSRASIQERVRTLWEMSRFDPTLEGAR